MPDLPEFDEILDLVKELKEELPKSRQGVKAAGRRARKILVKIKDLCPIVRRELRDSVVYPLEEPQPVETPQVQGTPSVESPNVQLKPPKKKLLTVEQLGRYLDLDDD